jgi:hypothetical protein
METPMNKSLLAATVASVVVAFGSPAFAQSAEDYPAEPSAQALQRAAPQSRALQARAQQIRPRNGSAYSTNPAHDVFDTNGNYVGSDPDPHVRAMLAHDRLGADDE